MADDDSKKQDVQYKPLDVVWPTSNSPCAFANNACIVSDGTIVHVMFAQVNPPFITGRNPDEAKEHFEKTTSVEASPVVRLAIPLSSFRTMIKTFAEHIDKMDKFLGQ